MAKNLDLTDINIVKQLITEINKSEERDRKQHTFDSWQIYSGNQKSYVAQELQRTRPKSWKSYTLSDISVPKMVVDKVAKAYKEQPIRDVGEERKNERLSEIYTEGKAKMQMPYLDTINNLHKYSLMWVNYNQEELAYQFMALQPYEYSVVRDKQTSELTAVILNYANLDMTSNANSGDGVDDLIAESQADSSAQSKVYAMWSKENFVVVVAENKKIKTMKGEDIEVSVTFVDDPSNMEKENRIGEIPFVFVSKELAVDFPTPSPLAFQSVTYNALNSENLTAGNLMGAGQMVISYPEKYEGKMKDITTGLTTAMKLPQSSNPDDSATTVQYINPGSDLSGQRENANDYLTKILGEHGINTDQALNTGAAQESSSGVALAIKGSNVQDIIEQNQLLYVEMEEQMFKIIKAWEAFLGSTVFKEEDELAVLFKKPKPMLDDKSLLELIEKKLSLGLIEEWEKFLILDPNLSEDEAREKLEKIKMEKQEKMGSLFGNTRVNIQDNQPGLEQGSEEPAQ